MKATYEEMRRYILDNNLAHLVRELNSEGSEESTRAAVEYVYDGHTMTKEAFRTKYFGA